jgi:hypothetical protein
VRTDNALALRQFLTPAVEFQVFSVNPLLVLQGLARWKLFLKIQVSLSQ